MEKYGEYMWKVDDLFNKKKNPKRLLMTTVNFEILNNLDRVSKRTKVLFSN